MTTEAEIKKEPLTLSEFADKTLEDNFRVTRLLRKVYFAIKGNQLMENKADSPDIIELTKAIGKEIGAE